MWLVLRRGSTRKWGRAACGCPVLLGPHTFNFKQAAEDAIAAGAACRIASVAELGAEVASLVAEAHRILMRGGVFMYPRDTKDASRPGRLRLLYEANPIGFVMEQAGGRASTGRQPVLRVQPSSLHQRIGFVFGSRSEVERIERYHHDPATREPATPLFAERSLFRD